MQNIPDILGGVVKAARLKAGITAEALTERLDVSMRYLYRIENKGQKQAMMSSTG